MIIKYKQEIHVDKTGTKKNSPWSNNRISFREDFKKRKYCCEELPIAMEKGFITTKHDNRDNMMLDYKDRSSYPSSPYFALVSIESDFGEGGTEIYYPIANCPFCGESFEFLELEIKEVIHKCKKRKVIEEVCESYTEEKIIG